MTVKIYHNPRCTKSRQTLELLKSKDIDPEVILYLENPPKDQEMKDLLKMLNMTARDILRKKESEFKELGLGDASLSDDKLIRTICENPKLLERPIVVNNGKAAIGRPPENILDII